MRLKKPISRRCGSSITSSSVFTGPAGISSLSNVLIQSAVGAAGELLAGQPIDLVDVAAPRRHVDEARILHHLRLATSAQNRRHCASV